MAKVFIGQLGGGPASAGSRMMYETPYATVHKDPINQKRNPQNDAINGNELQSLLLHFSFVLCDSFICAPGNMKIHENKLSRHLFSLFLNCPSNFLSSPLPSQLFCIFDYFDVNVKSIFISLFSYLDVAGAFTGAGE